MTFTVNINFKFFRRTDYKKHYKKLFDGNLVDHNHFDKAFQVYRFVYSNSIFVRSELMSVCFV